MTHFVSRFATALTAAFALAALAVPASAQTLMSQDFEDPTYVPGGYQFDSVTNRSNVNNVTAGVGGSRSGSLGAVIARRRK